MELKTAMFPWQEKAVEKLIKLRVGALYMEMGTGKTRAALEMIKRRLDVGKIDRVLWLCPCSIIESIRTDINKHSTGAEDVIQIYGIESLSGSKKLYGILYKYVSGGRAMLVVDESNLVKNSRAIRTQKITSIAEACPYRIILNGTPISRNEADLFAQWYILDWRILGYQSYYSFAANHLEYDDKYKHRVRRVLNVRYLTDKISPYTYMVKKSEAVQLPKKTYDVEHFHMDYAQFVHYEEEMSAFLSTLVSEDDSAAIYRTFTALQEIASGRRIVSDASEPIMHVPFYDDPHLNPRIQALKRVLGQFEDEKVVIWCKFQHEIDDISYILREKYGDDAVCIFCGTLTPKERNRSLKLFMDNARFFVANKTCAGYGLNLQFCHVAVYYNNDWDLATRAQSEDRIHRIGQAETVRIVDIAGYESIDSRILRCLSRKENMVESFKGMLKSKNRAQWLSGRDVDVSDTPGADKGPETGGNQELHPGA